MFQIWQMETKNAAPAWVGYRLCLGGIPPLLGWDTASAWVGWHPEGLPSMAFLATFHYHLFKTSLRSRSPPLVLGHCLLDPFLMAGERFDIGADRSSQVTHESALPISKHPLAPFVNGPSRQHPTTASVRCVCKQHDHLGNKQIRSFWNEEEEKWYANWVTTCPLVEIRKESCKNRKFPARR